jgi:hypothetical protein
LFSHCEALRQVLLPHVLEKLGVGTFRENGALREVRVPPSLREIGGDCFEKCASLGGLDVGGVTSFGDRAFADCSKLNLELPEGLTAMADSCFESCAGMTSVRVPPGITALPSSAFANSGLRQIEFHDAVTVIGDNSLQGTKIQHIRLPAGFDESWVRGSSRTTPSHSRCRRWHRALGEGCPAGGDRNQSSRFARRRDSRAVVGATQGNPGGQL